MSGVEDLLAAAVFGSEDAFLRLRTSHLGRLRLERSADGALTLRPPVDGLTESRTARLHKALHEWAAMNGSDEGVVFAIGTLFRLASGSVRSAGLAWRRKDGIHDLTREIMQFCPDFVAEFCGPQSALPDLDTKFNEFISNGASLGWIIDPWSRRVHVYTPAGPPHAPRRAIVSAWDAPETIDASPVLAGFVVPIGMLGLW